VTLSHLLLQKKKTRNTNVNLIKDEILCSIEYYNELNSVFKILIHTLLCEQYPNNKAKTNPKVIYTFIIRI